MSSVESRQSVAIIGTGMAGLITAYILRNDPRARFDVEVFEKVIFLNYFKYCTDSNLSCSKKSCRLTLRRSLSRITRDQSSGWIYPCELSQVASTTI